MALKEKLVNRLRILAEVLQTAPNIPT